MVVRHEQRAEASNVEQLIEARIAEELVERPWIRDKFEAIKHLVNNGSATGEDVFNAADLITDSDFKPPLVIAYYQTGVFTPYYLHRHAIHQGPNGPEELHQAHDNPLRRIELDSPSLPYRATTMIGFNDGMLIDLAHIFDDCQHQRGRIELELREKYLRDAYQISINSFGGLVEKRANLFPY